MYQSVRLTLALTLVLFAKNSRQSSDLLTYQIHSSNQEISYFINYLDHLFHILNQTLSEYEIETPANRTGELVRNSTCFNHIEHSILMARKETPWAIQSKSENFFKLFKKFPNFPSCELTCSME